MVETSSKTEKAVVLVGTIGSGVSGYLAALGKYPEAALAGTVSAAVVAFWSQGVNTEKKA